MSKGHFKPFENSSCWCRMASLSTLSLNIFVASGSDCNRPQILLSVSYGHNSLSLSLEFLPKISLPTDLCWPRIREAQSICFGAAAIGSSVAFPRFGGSQANTGTTSALRSVQVFQKSNGIPFCKQLCVNSTFTFLDFHSDQSHSVTTDSVNQCNLGICGHG